MVAAAAKVKCSSPLLVMLRRKAGNINRMKKKLWYVFCFNMELSGIIVNCTVLSQYVVNDIKIESLLQGIFRLSPTVLLSV